MKTENEPSPDGRWMDKANLCKVGLWTMVFLVIIWAMALWLDRPDEQPIRNSWVLAGHPLANHPTVGYEHLASYPMWGYSILKPSPP